MRFGISVPPFCEPRVVVEIAAEADRNGWDGVFVWDHLQFVRAWGLDVHDPWVLLGAMATATEHVRLGTLVTPLARRRPAKVAKELVTLDHLSVGRAVLGVGLGETAEDDFEAFGDPGDPRERAMRLDDGLAALEALLTGEPARHDGPRFRVDAHLRPAPVQRPRPPIWVGGVWPHRAPLRRAARYEGMVPIGGEVLLPPAGIAAVVTALDAYGIRKQGFDVVASWPAGVPAAEYADAGATWLVESRWPTGDWVDELRAVAGQPPAA